MGRWRRFVGIMGIITVMVLAIGCSKSLEVTESNKVTDKVIILEEGSQYSVFDGQDDILLQDGKIYLALDIIGKVFPYYLQNQETLLLTTVDTTYKMEKGILFAEDDEINYPCIQKGDKFLLPLDFLDNMDIHYTLLAENVVVLGDAFSKIEFIEGQEKNQDKEAKVIVLSQDSQKIKILDKHGKSEEIPFSENTEIKKIEKKEYAYNESIRQYDDKINLTFEGVYNQKVDTSWIGEMQGVNIIAPTWYELKNGQGDITSKLDEDYLSFAKEKSLEVWALYSNGFDKDRTREFLYNIEAREKTLEYLAQECLRYKLEGINLDFENIYEEDKDLLVSYVWQLSHELHKQDVVVSMDVTVKGGSSSWSLCYDRRQLARVADYIIVMTYDEHWADSPVSGSTSSYGWILKNINDILEEVPKDKLMMGMPLYTRIWTETISKKEVNKMETNSQTLQMKTTEELIRKNPKGVLLWDDEGKQYFFSYFYQDGLRKIWIEDEKSIAYKTSIAHDLDLQGVATWRRGQEKETIWEVIDRVLHGASPTEIEGTNYLPGKAGSQ